jgi:hypothetical protein
LSNDTQFLRKSISAYLANYAPIPSPAATPTHPSSGLLAAFLGRMLQVLAHSSSSLRSQAMQPLTWAQSLKQKAGLGAVEWRREHLARRKSVFDIRAKNRICRSLSI